MGALKSTPRQGSQTLPPKPDSREKRVVEEVEAELVTDSGAALAIETKVAFQILLFAFINWFFDVFNTLKLFHRCPQTGLFSYLRIDNIKT
ncbi:hypothetical protein ACFSJU_15940 [Paradesertivirga mongoliensis]|uniref:Uncharacterized protein n=1 Tax=Paradesertivirga mongoliensis TaxID=2100740 RepID=A0ABW4ZQ88_9SPHI|nr:hypothetical protein [Pedobacter mongoliensis]